MKVESEILKMSRAHLVYAKAIFMVTSNTEPVQYGMNNKPAFLKI